MLKRINRHTFAACAALFAFLAFFFLYRLTANSPKVADIAGLIVSCAMFGVAALAGLQADLERNLEKWLEPKTGAASSSVNSVEPYRQRTQREDLLQSLVHVLSPQIFNGLTAAELGGFIRETADAILRDGAPFAKSLCTCGPNAACSNCPKPRTDEPDRLAAAKSALTVSANRVGDAWAGIGAAAGRVTVGCMEPHLHSAGELADQRAEAEIVAKGLTAPRVKADQIQALMAKLTWHYEHEQGSRHTFAHAYLGDFYIATGHNAPVSRENFDASLGMKYAREQAETKVRDELWKLEGYVLHSFPQLVHSRTDVA